MYSILKKKKSNISIKKKYIISTSYIENKIYKKLSILQKKIVINGFRKGKVPIKILENYYRDDIFYKILKKKMHKNFIKFIQKKNIQNYKNVKYNFKKYILGTDFHYTIKFDVVLDKLIKKLKSIILYKLEIYISKRNIEKVMLNFQKNISNWVKKKSEIKKNDKVTIKYQLKSKNNNTNILKNKKYSILVNKNLLLKKIFYSIIGKRIGDSITINIHFSKYHPEKKISGKKITILMKIIDIQEKKEKKINFKKFKNFGFIEKNIIELKKNIYVQLKEECKKITREYLKKQFIKIWIKINKKKIYLNQNNKILFMIRKYSLKYKEQFISQYKKNKNIFEKLYNKNIYKISIKKTIINILIKKIISEQSLFVSQKLIKKIFKNAKEKFLKKHEKNNKVNKKIILKNIQNFLLREQAFNFIFKNIIIKNKKIDLNSALKKNINNYL